MTVNPPVLSPKNVKMVVVAKEAKRGRKAKKENGAKKEREKRKRKKKMVRFNISTSALFKIKCLHLIKVNK